MKKRKTGCRRLYRAAVLVLCLAVMLAGFSPASMAAADEHIFIIKDHITDEQLRTPRVTYHFLRKGELYADNDDVYSAPYYYFKNDAEKDVCIQIVKNGEKLVEPPVPRPIRSEEDNAVYRFYGWYVVEPESADDQQVVYRWPVKDSRFDFRSRVDVTEDGDVYLAPLYQNARFLVFHEDTIDGSNTQGIVSRKIVGMARRNGTSCAEVTLSGIKAPLQNSFNEYFYGWCYYDGDGTRHDIPFYSNDGRELDPVEFTVTDDMLSQKTVTLDGREYTIGDDRTLELFPLYVDAHWLNFDTASMGGGATYAEAKFVTRNTEIRHLETSTMAGYTFSGWYSQDGVMVADSSGALVEGARFTGGSVTGGCIRLTDHTTLSARWQADGSTPYKVVYWFENAGDSGYTYGGHLMREHQNAGTLATEDPPVSPAMDPPDGESRIGFHLYGSDRTSYPDETDSRYLLSAQQTTIANDGSTVVNIYYNRNDVTMTFRYQQRMGTEVSSSDPVVFTLTRKYGEKIKDVFSSPPFSTTYQNVKWKDVYGTVYDSNSPFKTLEEMPEKDVTVYGVYGARKGEIYYYTELLPGQTSDITFQGRYFSLYKEISHNFNYLTYKEDFHLIEGFYEQKDHALPPFGTNNRAQVSSSPYDYRLYYFRSSYQLRFMFHDGVTEDKLIGDISYQQPLADKTDVPELAAYLPGQYEEDINNVHMVFMGWYDNPALEGEPIDLHSGTMPSHDVTLHAKWEKKYYHVMIDTAGGVLEQGQSTWFYRQHGDSFSRYNLTRQYIPAEEGYTGTKYYRVNEVYDPRFDAYSDSYIGNDPQYNRRAQYITEEQFSDYRREFIDTATVYKYEPNAYSLMGWYRVREDGTLADSRPYNFSDPVTQDITIRAVWRRSGLYYLRYDAMNTAPDQQDVVHTVFGYLDDNGTETVEQEPSPEEQALGKGFDDQALVTVRSAPDGYQDIDGITWVFEGWRVYRSGEPVGGLFSPGDEMQVDSELAVDKVITLRAVYASLDHSCRIPRTVDLVLDANQNASVNAGNVPAQDGAVGTYTESVRPTFWEAWSQPLHQGVWMNRQNKNFSVTLADYADEYLNGGRNVFCSASHDLLLGWDSESDPDRLPNGAYLPSYYADAVIGVYREQGDTDHTPEILYALWEPMVYLTLVNDTGTQLHLTLTGPDPEAVSVVNVINGVYARAALQTDEQGRITLSPGQTLPLVVPKAADSAFQISGEGYQLPEGRMLLVETTAVAPDAGTTASFGFDSPFTAEGTFRRDETGVTVTFRSDEQYTLTLDSNYPSAPAPATACFNGLDGSYELPSVSRSGYLFAGWAETSDGSVKFSAAAAPLTEIFGTAGEKHKTLYAQWRSETTNVPVRYLMQDSSGAYREITGNTAYLNSSAKSSLNDVGLTAVDVPAALAYRSFSGASPVYRYLNSSYRNTYTQVAYALGSRSAAGGTSAADFGLRDIVNNNGSSGNPKIRNSLDGLLWNTGAADCTADGTDTAVYVIFSQAQMVHITVTAEIADELGSPDTEFTYTAVFGGKGDLGSGRQSEQFTLKSGESRIITLLYSKNSSYQSLTLTQSPVEGYTTTVTQKLTGQEGAADGSISGLTYTISAAKSTQTSQKNSDTTVVFRSEGQLPPPTAVRTRVMPFAVMLAAAGAVFGGLFFLSRRRRRHAPDSQL